MRKILLKIILFLALILIAWVLHQAGFFYQTLEWAKSLGPWGPILFILVYALTCIFFFPSIIFTFAGGFLFGLFPAVLYSLIGQGMGSLSAFLIGRYLARDYVTRAFSKNKNFHRIDHAIRKKGWKIIALCRLSPIFPFLVGNYGFGLTNITARSYLGASLLGTIPSTTVYTYMGSVSANIAALGMEGRARTMPEWILLIGGLIITMALVFYIRRISRDALSRDLSDTK